MKLNDVTGDLVIHRKVYTDAVVYIWRFWTKRRLFNVLYIVDNLFIKRPAKATSKNPGNFSEFLLKPHDFLKIFRKIVENHNVIAQKNMAPLCRGLSRCNTLQNSCSLKLSEDEIKPGKIFLKRRL